MFQLDQVWSKNTFSSLNYAAHCQMLEQSVLDLYSFSLSSGNDLGLPIEQETDHFPMLSGGRSVGWVCNNSRSRASLASS